MMARIGFFPLYEASHINATYGLAKRLRARGHIVSYLAPLDFEEQIKAQGFNFIPFCPALFPRGFQGRIVADPASEKNLWVKAFKMLCRGELDAEVRTCSFDLLMVDTWAQHLALIAYKIGVPTILLSPTLPTMRAANVPPATEAIVPNSLSAKLKIRLCWFKYDLRRLRLYLRKQAASYVQPMRTLATSANYPLKYLDATGPYPVLKLFPELILCPEAFDLPRSRKDGRIRYIGAFVDLSRKDSVEFPWNRIDSKRELIYCALGLLSHRFGDAKELLQKIIDAVASKPEWQLVIVIGQHLKVADFEPVPANVIVVNRAPQVELVKIASLAITHGGLNSIKESILCGTPMIVLPWSRPLNGVRVVYHGLGLMENIENVSVEKIRSMIETVDKDPSFKARVEAMKKKFIEAENSEAGVTFIESSCLKSNEGAATAHCVFQQKRASKALDSR
jgi:MGT family glycosyltransferase